MDRVSATGFAFDFGFQYKDLFGGIVLVVDVVVKNLGPKMKFDRIGLFITSMDPNASSALTFLKLESRLSEFTK